MKRYSLRRYFGAQESDVGLLDHSIFIFRYWPTGPRFLLRHGTLVERRTSGFQSKQKAECTQ